MRYSQADHRWQYNTALAPCMLDNKGYRHTHSEYVIPQLHCNSGYVNELQWCICTYIACLVRISGGYFPNH